MLPLGFVEKIRPVNLNAVSIESKLQKYKLQTSAKTFDSSRFKSEADHRFRSYIDRQVESLMMVSRMP